MFCNKCGNELAKGARFCSLCGNKIEDEIAITTECCKEVSIDSITSKTKLSKRGGITIFCVLILVLILGAIAVLNVIRTSEDDALQIADNDGQLEFSAKNSSLQANLSSWGMTCSINEDIFYSDMETGIYIRNSETKFASGIYSDLCCLDDKLVCVEYYDEQMYARLVIFDVQTKEKKIAFTAPSGEDYFMISNVIDDKVYFTLSENALFECDLNGEIIDTGIRNARKVTQRGIYTAQYSKSGLRLVSFENKEIKLYDKLLKYNVIVYFEINGKLYAKISEEASDTYEFVIIDIETGNYEQIKNQKEFGQMTNVNFKDNTLFCAFVETKNNIPFCLLYKSNLDGSNMQYLTRVQMSDVNTTLNLISVFDD